MPYQDFFPKFYFANRKSAENYPIYANEVFSYLSILMAIFKISVTPGDINNSNR